MGKSKKKVKIVPASQRAKNRVREHGNVFFLQREGLWEGRNAIFVKSLNNTWWGWFDSDECSWEIV